MKICGRREREREGGRERGREREREGEGTATGSEANKKRFSPQFSKKKGADDACALSLMSRRFMSPAPFFSRVEVRIVFCFASLPVGTAKEKKFRSRMKPPDRKLLGGGGRTQRRRGNVGDTMTALFNLFRDIRPGRPEQASLGGKRESFYKKIKKTTTK